jgi:hypothetical protein
VIGVPTDGEEERVVGGGVASVQGGDEVDPLRHRCVRDGRLDELEALEAEPRRPLGPAPGEVRARLDREQRSLARALQEELVEDEAERALPGAAVHEHRVAEAGQHVVHRRREQVREVVHLLQLPERVGVEVARPREEVQLLEQRGRGARQQLAADRLALHLPAHAPFLTRVGRGRAPRERLISGPGTVMGGRMAREPP